MRSFTAIVERDAETGLYVGYVPGFAGAHSKGATLDELRDNLGEVISMLLEDDLAKTHFDAPVANLKNSVPTTFPFSIRTPSVSSISSFFATPPAYPVSRPSDPTTRWQGTRGA